VAHRTAKPEIEVISWLEGLDRLFIYELKSYDLVLITGARRRVLVSSHESAENLATVGVVVAGPDDHGSALVKQIGTLCAEHGRIDREQGPEFHPLHRTTLPPSLVVASHDSRPLCAMTES
jgi:hypothetical protein